MKRIITLLALIVIASAAHAQTDSLVTFDTKGETLGISIAGFNISLGEDASQKSYKKTPKRVSTNFAGIKWGLNSLGNSTNYGNWAGSDIMMDNTPSSRFGIEAMGILVALDRQNRFFFKTALNLNYDIYMFKKPLTFINDENGVLLPAPISGTVKKSKMVAQYFGGSAGFGFRISKVHFIFDFEACILGQSYVKYKNPGKTRYDISGLNNIMYNVGMEASLHGGGIYVDYSLNPIFRTGTGNDGHILSIGCMFGF